MSGIVPKNKFVKRIDTQKMAMLAIYGEQSIKRARKADTEMGYDSHRLKKSTKGSPSAKNIMTVKTEQRTQEDQNSDNHQAHFRSNSQMEPKASTTLEDNK